MDDSVVISAIEELEVSSVEPLEPGTGFSVPVPGLFANCVSELSSPQAVSAIVAAIPRTLNELYKLLSCIWPLMEF